MRTRTASGAGPVTPKAVAARLDRIATHLEKHGLKNAAAELDMLANTVEAAKFTATVPETEPGNSADEAASEDPLDVSPSQYHKMPVGADNVSEEVFGMTTPTSTNPDFATDHPVDILSSRGERTAESTDLHDLTSFPLSTDVWDIPEVAGGGIATTDLPESGGPGSKALDDDQKPNPIPPMRTRPGGSIHASLQPKRTALVAAVESGVLSKKEAQTRWGQIVEQFNKGGRTAGKQQWGAFPPPAIVPPIGYPVWAAAIRVASKQGKLLTASKQPNRPAVVRAYVELLDRMSDAVN